jgi:hypothetical protein
VCLRWRGAAVAVDSCGPVRAARAAGAGETWAGRFARAVAGGLSLEGACGLFGCRGFDRPAPRFAHQHAASPGVGPSNGCSCPERLRWSGCLGAGGPARVATSQGVGVPAVRMGCSRRLGDRLRDRVVSPSVGDGHLAGTVSAVRTGCSRASRNGRRAQVVSPLWACLLSAGAVGVAVRIGCSWRPAMAAWWCPLAVGGPAGGDGPAGIRVGCSNGVFVPGNGWGGGQVVSPSVGLPVW